MKNKLVPWKRRGESSARKGDEHSLDLLHREIDDLFEGYYRGFGSLARPFAMAPSFEVSETDDEIRVTAELPGMDEKDIAISLDENVLTIRGERQEQHEDKHRNYQVSERSYGHFSRTFPLSGAIDRDQVSATLKRGVLTLTLPKTERSKNERRHIPIRVD